MSDAMVYYLMLFLATAAGYLIRKYVLPGYRQVTAINPDDLEGLSKWALKLCRAAKNMSSTLSSAYARREWVLEQLQALCKKCGIVLTDEQVRALLEAAYDEMLAEDAIQASNTALLPREGKR